MIRPLPLKKIYPNRLHVAALLLVLAGNLIAQQADWKYTSGGAGAGGVEQFFTISQTADDGYITAGRRGPLGLNAGDFYIVKLSPTGTLDWSKTYAGNYIDEVRAIKQLPDGSYVFTGVTVDYPDTSAGAGNLQDMILVKLDAAGDTVWVKHFGSTGADTGDGLDTTGDGGLLAIGRYTISGNNNDFYLVKTDANGDELWSKTYGGAASDVARSVKHTKDGGYIIAGTTKSFGPSASVGNIWLLKTDAQGDTLWTKVIGGDNEEECYSVTPTADGGYILTGRTGAILGGESDIYVVKTDSAGNTEWSKTYGSNDGNDLGRDIIQTTDGDYALTGYKVTTQGSEPPLLYVLQIDAQGDRKWDTLIGNYDSPNGAKGYSIQQTRDGGLIVAGENDLGNGSLDNRAMVLKFSGNVITGIEEQELQLACRVYPNPFTDAITFSFAINLMDNNLHLFNTNGQLVKFIPIDKQQVTLQAGELPKGIYFYRITGQTGETRYSGKIVLQ